MSRGAFHGVLPLALMGSAVDVSHIWPCFLFFFLIILCISVLPATAPLLCDQLRKRLNYLVCFNKVSSPTDPSVGAVSVNSAQLPQALRLAGTHISHSVSDAPPPAHSSQNPTALPRPTHSAGIIIFVFMCCSLGGLRGVCLAASPEASSLCLRVPAETPGRQRTSWKNQQLLIGQRNLFGISPPCFFFSFSFTVTQLGSDVSD